MIGEGPPLRVVFTGDVDHGKSTLIARILLDTGAFPDGRYEELVQAAKRRRVPLELSFLLDALQIERDQAITVDAGRLWFSSGRRRYAVIDAPGHGAFLRNMISGAADATAAVLVIDAGEGVAAQTRRHAALLALLGVRDVVVAVNKMDTVDGQARFGAVVDEIAAVFARLDLRLVQAVPTIARDGDGIVQRGERFAWYSGPTLLSALDAIADGDDGLAAKPLRLAVQDVYRRDGQRIIVGHVAAGTLQTGSRIVVQPSGESAVVNRIVAFPNADCREVPSGAAAAFTLDRDVFVQPGDVVSAAGAPAQVVRLYRAATFCLDPDGFTAETMLQLRIATRDTPIVIERIEARLNFDTLGDSDAQTMRENDVGVVVFRPLEALVVDPSLDELKRFALYRHGRIVGGGVILAEGLVSTTTGRPRSPYVAAVHGVVTQSARQQLLGQRGVVLWLTGLPSSGKSTLAVRLEADLIARGRMARILDGDTLRTGLTGDLTFSDADRAENVRRIAEVAALFASAEIIAICAIVSPYRADRDRAREICAGAFYEVFLDADLATCEARDPKGLYRRARAGEIPHFTGISSPYERPERPDLIVASATQSIDDNVAELREFVLSVASLPDR